MTRFGVAMLFLGLSSSSGATPGRPLDPQDHTDRERMVNMLLKRVAYIKVKPKLRPDDAFKDEVQDGFAVAIAPRRLVCQSFIVQRAVGIEVIGPNGKRSRAKVLLSDVDRRVAVLEPELEASKLGLEVVVPLEKSERVLDQVVFALSATIEPYLLDGVLTDLGSEPETEGILLSDMQLTRGMPIFDDRGRFVGYSRAVDWDTNKLMIVSPELIRAARSATTTASARENAPRPPPPESSSGWLRGRKEAR